MRLWCAIVAGALLTFATVPGAWAQKSVNDKGRTVYHFVKSEVMQVGDVPGHVLGIVDASGLSFLDSGEVAIYSTKITFDLRNGTGRHEGYGVTTFEDKSTMVTLVKGTTTGHSDGTSTFEGTYTFVGGTGRFAGIMGAGSYKGKRLAPVTSGSLADTFSDYSGSYTLPSQ